MQGQIQEPIKHQDLELLATYLKVVIRKILLQNS